MTPEALQEAEAAYKVASAEETKRRETRNALVLQALSEGWTHAQIARATGLTRGRIGQIAQTTKPA